MLSVGKLHSTMLTFSSLMLKPNKIRTFDSMIWTPEHIHLTKWKTPASSKSATVRPGLRTCQSSYRPSRRSLPGCVRESRRERSKGKNGGIKNYYSPTDRQGYNWSRGIGWQHNAIWKKLVCFQLIYFVINTSQRNISLLITPFNGEWEGYFFYLHPPFRK